MCGIAAYKGTKQASPILLEALRKMEYRGYDSAGIATVHDGVITVRKDTGKVEEVNKKVQFSELKGTTGISHSRWATTGSVTQKNAHPHYSSDKKLAVVQNGIVENYQELKATLEEKGYSFQSETDTEVIAKLVEDSEHDLLQAVQDAFLQLHGRNAFVVLDSTGSIVAAKKGSPLILGIGEDALFLASDPAALLEHTKNVIFIEDNELVVLDDAYTIYNANTLQELKKEPTTINWTVEQAQKGNYDHFMIKEIMEQKECIMQALAQPKELIQTVVNEINGAFGTYVVGCGTAGKVALTSTYAFSDIAKMHINFAFGSEFPSYHDFLTEKSLLIAISQSGETADTLEALETAKAKGGKIISVVNVMGSTMMRKSDHTLMVNAGPEISVCSTKATTNQLAIMYLLAYACNGRYDEGLSILKGTAAAVDEMLNDAFCAHVKKLAEKLLDQPNIYVIGRGMNYPMALEAAIKIQEVSYIHAEGFAGGELKHGPLALIDKDVPVIAFVANDETKEDILANAEETKARGAYVIGIAPENNDVFDYWIQVPDCPETSPIPNIVPVQLLAYYLSTMKGNDVDKPKNLSKCVSVK
ncbi:MAG: glutamine--fructose-6-phosphate transaminase (isomerizing) [Candidatus Woesearchaeota archaeon]|nr:glutamine--fructose-6-phosphate transaminase (isomerizing) [Candidatus Woesearchaeota archaeon]